MLPTILARLQLPTDTGAWLAAAGDAGASAASSNALAEYGAIGIIAAMAIGALAWIVKRQLQEKDELRAEVRELNRLRAAEVEKFLPVLMSAASTLERNNEAQREMTQLGARFLTEIELMNRQRRD